MPKFQRRSSSILCTYATLLGFHSRERCCRGGRKDSCLGAAGSPALRQGNIPLLPVYTTLSIAVLSTFCCTACTRRLKDDRIYCCTRNLVCTLNIPLLPVYTTLSTAVLSTSYVLSTYCVFFLLYSLYTSAGRS